MYTLAKVMWFREKMPDLYRNTSSFMLFGDYITFMLSGKAVIDYSLASRTMALNIVDNKWDSKMLGAAGIDRDLFSTLAPAGTTVGNIRPELADELGINRNALVVTGSHDQVCAAVGSGILEDGMAVNGMGTSECITPFIKSAVTGPKMLESNFGCVPYIMEGTYVTYAFNFTGGSLLKWYRDNFAYQQVMQSKKTGESPYTILDREAFNKPTDIFVLPHFAGTGTPYMDVSAKGAILGLTFDVTPGILYKALMEGVVYEMFYNVECLEQAGIPIKGLRAVGGGAKSDLWLQLKADIMGRKIEKLNIDEAGNLGNIMIAGIATGVYKSYKDAAEQFD